MKTPLRLAFSFAGLLLLSVPASAQWITRTVVLQPGWNAVYLDVQPEPRASDRVFANVPVDVVWMWNRQLVSIQFIDRPDELIPDNPNWLAYMPAGHPSSSQSRLFTILGGHCYLIKLAGSKSELWTVIGTPLARPPEWIPDSLNFVGLPPATATPSFAAIFAASQAHATNPVYRLAPDGSWEVVTNPTTTGPRLGEAFWVRTTGPSDFRGPLGVQLDQPGKLDFGRQVVEQTLRIKNATTSSRNLLLRLPANDPPPPPAGMPLRAGAVPLSWFLDDPRSPSYGWNPLPAQLDLGAVAPGQERRLRIAVRRQDFANFELPLRADAASYQSVLEVLDSTGSFVQRIPVTAEPVAQWESTTQAGPSLMGGSQAPNPRAGLWIGDAVITHVSQPAHPSEPLSPKEINSSSMSFRLLIHVDRKGQARLLREVFEVWRNGTLSEDGRVIEPGRQVLVTDTSKLKDYSGSMVRGGQVIGRRFSTVAFAFDTPQPMAGKFGDPTAPVTCKVSLGYDDRLNPFKHRFHPDHNNLSENYRELVTPGHPGQESFNIDREISLRFNSVDLENRPEYGTKLLGGNYQEVVSGIHRANIVIQGTFTLHLASTVGLLNDGL